MLPFILKLESAPVYSLSLYESTKSIGLGSPQVLGVYNLGRGSELIICCEYVLEFDVTRDQFWSCG